MHPSPSSSPPRVLLLTNRETCPRTSGRVLFDQLTQKYPHPDHVFHSGAKPSRGSAYFACVRHLPPPSLLRLSTSDLSLRIARSVDARVRELTPAACGLRSRESGIAALASVSSCPPAAGRSGEDEHLDLTSASVLGPWRARQPTTCRPTPTSSSPSTTSTTRGASLSRRPYVPRSRARHPDPPLRLPATTRALEAQNTYDSLLRALLVLPSKPAIVNVHVVAVESPTKAMLMGGETSVPFSPCWSPLPLACPGLFVDGWLSSPARRSTSALAVAAFYDVPTISTAMVLLPKLIRNPELTTDFFDPYVKGEVTRPYDGRHVRLAPRPLRPVLLSRR